MQSYLLLFWCAAAVVGVSSAVLYERHRNSIRKKGILSARKTKNTSLDYNPDLVVDPEDAAFMFQQIKRDMARTFGFLPSSSISAQLVSKAELYRKCPPHMRHLDPIGLFCVKEGKIFIYILSGLPRISFYATLAHEYAHVWQRLDGFACRNFEQLEGFAEWVSFILTDMAGFNVSQEFDRPEWDVYGTGMRKFKTMQQLFGNRGAASLGKRRGLNMNILKGNY